ncbi:PCC domain-containing protein [Terrarubrum flagellatum]|uniref:PCC domain-containing protein n=1 Tax=Terrirubrum flagellatum TaxID=2895980 RepID=UPI003144D59E
MRRVAQPGPEVTERIQWVEARGRAFSFTMEKGLTLLEATRRGFERAGFASGVLSFDAGALGPFAYVMPALSKTRENAAFYSDIFRPAGVTRLTTGAMTFGERDGAPFFHCHALWIESDGRANGGHILPDETVIAEPFTVRAFGIDGAAFVAEPDLETNFKLFGPIARDRSGADAPRQAFALRLRPNQDMAQALEDFCRARGLSRARLHGGVGSIIGARYQDGRISEPFATEMAVRSGVIETEGDDLRASLDVVLVDYTGSMSEGRLARGDNPILMTLEIVIEII